MEHQGGKQEKDSGRYRLKLYVTGTTPISSRAVVNVRQFCEEYLADCHDLEIIDVLRTPGVAKEMQLIAVPTLVKELPLPERRFIGDMSATERLIAGLQIKPIA
jgi:circadian clock protein KaiB